jgi:hypothetical protein
MLKWILTLIIITCLLCLQSFSQDNLNIAPLIEAVDSSDIFIQEDYYLWCSSVIKGEDGKYHMFYSRWAHGKRPLDDDSMNYIFDGFRGWNKYSEIAYAVSDKISGPYKEVKTILKGDGDPNKWDRFTMHNPQVRKFGEFYYLYYISNSYDSTLFNDSSFAKEWKHWLHYNATQKIGVIKFKSFKNLLNGKFSKPSLPLMAPDNKRTYEVTTNPTVTQGPDGKFYMLFKSRKPNVGNMTFWMAVSYKPDGPYLIASEVFTDADMACEDPCMWYDKKRKRFYAAVKYYSNSKKIVSQFGALALITSDNGLDWRAANHPLVSLRKLKMRDGSEVELSHLERPFVVTDKNGQPTNLFAAAAIKEPSGGDVLHVTADNNTFIVCFSLNKSHTK